MSLLTVLHASRRSHAVTCSCGAHITSATRPGLVILVELHVSLGLGHRVVLP